VVVAAAAGVRLGRLLLSLHAVLRHCLQVQQ
jgi:hypothetical protein